MKLFYVTLGAGVVAALVWYFWYYITDAFDTLRRRYR